MSIFEKIIPSRRVKQPTTNERILLIEDNPADARLLEILLEDTDLGDYEIVTKTTFGAANELLKDGEKFEVILLDLYLPDSNKFEALKQLKTDFPNSNVIMMTGLNDKNVGLQAVKAGAQDFLVKGAVDSDTLAKTLRYAIERNRVIQRLEETQQHAMLTEVEMTKSQKRYREIFTQSKDSIYISTLTGELIDFNESTENLFKRSRENLQNQSIHDFFITPERKNEFLLKLKLTQSIIDYRIDVIRPNGEIRNCQLSANMLSTEDFSGYNCILRDITESIQADQLRKARDLAAHSAKMKEQFIASISHEMRTPMNAILGMSNILVQTELDTEQTKLVSSIKQSSEILLGIVNDILEISSMQNQKINFVLEDFELKELMDNLVNVMQYKAQEKDLYFQVFIGSNVPNIIRTDKLRLNQVLLNLVGNAIKFTEEGYVKIYVDKLSDYDGGVHLQFTVEDSGIGIPKDKADAVFESFTRIRNKEKLYEGTGLGLAICKNIVEQQGGKIACISDLGHGSKFYFDLLIELGNENNIKRTPDIEEFQFDEEQPFNLLLVEDHKMNQLVAKKTLQKKFKNINLTIADNGQIAVDFLKEKSFDLVLMDIQMPIMDGYEATDYIRNNMPPEVANLPILAMTAHAHIAKDESYKKHGMDDFVLKPFRPEELFSKIKKYLILTKAELKR